MNSKFTAIPRDPLKIPEPRFQFCFGVSADLLVRLQAQHDFQKSLHSKEPCIHLEATAFVHDS